MSRLALPIDSFGAGQILCRKGHVTVASLLSHVELFFLSALKL